VYNQTLGMLTDSLAPLPVSMSALVPEALSLDSRTINRGDAFVAVKGVDVDGRRYINDALTQGAVAVLAEAEGLTHQDPRVIPVAGLKSHLGELARRFYADPSTDLCLVAVTGTNGKTSISDYTAQLLRLLGKSAGTIGTLGARTQSGDAAEAKNTTPDVFTLNKHLATWRNDGVKYAAIEASSHALQQGRLDGLSVHTGVFSNLTRDHLDYHGDLKAYRQAKLRLFTEFMPDRVIYNLDDTATVDARHSAKGHSFGLSLTDASADVFIRLSNDCSAGLAFQVQSPFGTAEITTALHGQFNAFNVTAAIITVCGLGFTFKDVANAAHHLRSVEGRMQVVKGGGDTRVVVDFAHTPDALERALTALSQSCSGDLWAVFGCGGDRDVGKRSEMGRVAQALADRVVVTNDNPRSEDPLRIAQAIAAGCSGDGVHIELDRAEAIRYAIRSAKAGDTVLVAGKGHENYQHIGHERRPFSDVVCAEQALWEREGGLQ